MNIEDERKAFLLGCCDMMGNAYYPVDTGFANGEFYDPTVQRLFAVWLKAKAHAEEMLKPAVVVEHWVKYNTYSVKLPKGRAFRNIELGFESEKAAIYWAECNGYRVIE